MANSNSHSNSITVTSSTKHHFKNGIVFRPCRHCCCCITFTLVILLSAASIFVFWPSDPDVKIEQLSLRHVKVHPIPPVSAVLLISVAVKVRNGDIYWMDLTDVDIGVRYRGIKLGHVETEEWHVRGWGWCHVFGDIEYSRLPSSDVIHLVEDMTKGKTTFHVLVEVSGQLGFLIFRFPYVFKAIRSCDVLVNTKNHSIIHQHCLHKVSLMD
ncbi:hypothetical protein Ahy_B09g094805 [Arachis hypogaea]|uniref:Late embryogenesis abundant protein LEA-2 subgroup domain-containing protein n=1 Tax=Arachis hypogaea TaxID=3818 RepID=A0A444XCV9_ARAHY|nr:hypothetical protein Ahy_B09g094805 [Arachis hypogaea]